MPIPQVEFSEEDINLNLESTEFIQVRNNTITFGNTVLHIANISRITVRKWKRNKNNNTSEFFIFLWIAFGALISALSSDPTTKLTGGLIVVAGIFFYSDNKLRKGSYIYLLIMELNSGSVRFFKDSNSNSLEKAAHTLRAVIENPLSGWYLTINIGGDVVHNTFDNSINTGGGDLINSLLNTGINQGSNSY